jgi:hypothetical protein
VFFILRVSKDNVINIEEDEYSVLYYVVRLVGHYI